VNDYEIAAVLLFLVVAWGHGFSVGVAVNSVHDRLRDARADATEDAAETVGGDDSDPPGADGDSEIVVPTDRGTDYEVERLRTVRESDRAELEEINRGYQGRDLSDSEVKEWLDEWNL